MHINGCHVVSKLNAKGAEGFETHVTKQRIVDSQVDGQNVSQKQTSTQGPFFKLSDAITFAHAWTEFESPPVVPNYEETHNDPTTDSSIGPISTESPQRESDSPTQ